MLAAPKRLDNLWAQAENRSCVFRTPAVHGGRKHAPLRGNIFKALLGFYVLRRPARMALLRLSPKPNVPHPKTATLDDRFARRAYG